MQIVELLLNLCYLVALLNVTSSISVALSVALICCSVICRHHLLFRCPRRGVIILRVYEIVDPFKLHVVATCAINSTALNA